MSGVVLNEEQRHRLVRAYADRLILNQHMTERTAVRYAEQVVNHGMAVASGQRWRAKDEDSAPWSREVLVDEVFVDLNGHDVMEGRTKWGDEWMLCQITCQHLVSEYELAGWDE